ncbi:MAG: aminoacyl-tRNA hydrolase [Firmicutes bacterium]|nr:aminoacyl-tRNA hydrolase [Alicyclobacillaceae bacterium]MCL6497214.1 aminoacyl-tRNA hydrolase [Bacillota bacterium]
MRLVVGLGNPGPRYAHTRHNLGFLTVDRLAQAAGTTFSPSRFEALVAPWQSGVTLMKPTTFMNRSGTAVAAWVRWYRLNPAEVLVVADDLDLPFGRLRLRPAGSAGGHNGLASVLAELGTEAVPRLRIGIGRPPAALGAVAWVLGPFGKEEASRLPTVLEAACAAVTCVVQEGLEVAMNRFNRAQSWG